MLRLQILIGIAASVVAFVAAAPLSDGLDVPGCVSKCWSGSQAITACGKDSACLCDNADFFNAYHTCAFTDCSSRDMASAVNLAVDRCNTRILGNYVRINQHHALLDEASMALVKRWCKDGDSVNCPKCMYHPDAPGCFLDRSVSDDMVKREAKPQIGATCLRGQSCGDITKREAQPQIGMECLRGQNCGGITKREAQPQIGMECLRGQNCGGVTKRDAKWTPLACGFLGMNCGGTTKRDAKWPPWACGLPGMNCGESSDTAKRDAEAQNDDACGPRGMNCGGTTKREAQPQIGAVCLRGQNCGEITKRDAESQPGNPATSAIDEPVNVD